MKRSTIILALLLLAAALTFAEDPFFTFSGVTDGYVAGNAEGGSATAGQDLNFGFGPVYLKLTADITQPLWEGNADLALAYTLGFSRAFGAFTPKVELTGDQALVIAPGKEFTGDLFSDLTPSLNIAAGKVGLDVYADFSFEEGYELFQTADFSAYATPGPASFRLGVLYMTEQAVTDDVGHPNGPKAIEGVSFYAKASVNY